MAVQGIALFLVIGCTILQSYRVHGATECKELLLNRLQSGAVGTADAEGYKEFKTDGSGQVELKFPTPLKRLSMARIKPPEGTQAGDKFKARITFVTYDGTNQTMKTGMTVLDLNRPLNLPYPQHTKLDNVQITVSVHRGETTLPAPKTFKVLVKGCFIEIAIPTAEAQTQQEETGDKSKASTQVPLPLPIFLCICALFCMIRY